MPQDWKCTAAIGGSWALAHRILPCASAGTGPPLIPLDSGTYGPVAAESKAFFTKRYRPCGYPGLYKRTGLLQMVSPAYKVVELVLRPVRLDTASACPKRLGQGPPPLRWRPGRAAAPDRAASISPLRVGHAGARRSRPHAPTYRSPPPVCPAATAQSAETATRSRYRGVWTFARC